ncbi:MAG: PAS domain S-box protein [Ignavibacteriae bacterium]|nr:PAS domain S-box protein [Ignavibacteriota bacterium]
MSRFSLSIRNKLVILFSLLVLIISIFIYIYVPSRIEEQAGHALREKTKSIARMTAFSLSSALVFHDVRTLNEELQGAKQNSDVVYIVIHNDTGNVVSEYNLVQAEQQAYSVIDTHNILSANEQLYKTSTPIFSNNKNIGTLFIGVSLSNVRREVEKSKNNIALVSFFVFLTGILTVIGFSSLVTSPLRQMVKTVDTISEGDLTHRAVVVSNDEVGHLARSFNRMVDNVQTAHEELEQLNRTLERRVDERTKELRLEINERKQAESKLRESEERFRQLSEASFEGIAIHSQGILLEGNTTLARMFGYDLQEMIGKNATDFAAPESKALVEKNIRSGIESPYETVGIRKDGTTFPVELIGRAMNYHGKNARVTAIRDITERKQAENALRDSEQKLRQSLALQKRLLSSLPTISFITTDFQAMITSFSPGAEQIFGYTAEEVIGKSVALVHLPEDAAKFPEIIRKQLAGHIGYSGEMTLIRKNGEQFPAQFITAPIMDADGTVMGLLGVSQDITERKRLEDQLRQAQKMESIGTLAGGIAHDFNNILGIILGYVSSLQRNKDFSKQQFDKSAEAINKVIIRGANLVRQLLTFARKTDVQFEPTNVNDIIIELVKMIQETFPKTITATFSLDKNLPFIIADHNQLHQSLLNLCVNARDAMPNGGTINIATSIAPKSSIVQQHPEAQEEYYASILLSDTGTGMKRETVERIFEPFFTTKEIGKGTGLGLAVVYGIVQSHHGFVDVESIPGSGTTFRILLPMVPGSIEAIKQEPEIEQFIPGGTETILIIEDEELLLELIDALLQQYGYTVLTAHDGEEAISLYEKHHSNIQLVVTDLGLPKMSGWQVFLKMKEINRNVKVVLATGYLEPHEKNLFFDGGILDILTKPYEPAELLKKVHQVMHTPS